MEQIEHLISERVNVAMENQFRLEMLSPETGKKMTHVERKDMLMQGFREIVKGMGVDRFAETPVERLDQFLVMSIVKNHDTAGLLRSLVNSFMIAYSHPETADRAFEMLVKIEGLRAEIARKAGQPSENPALLTAAMELERQLIDAFPEHSAVNPGFQIVFGADRLYVSTARSVSNLPNKIGNVPVEFIPSVPVTPKH